MKKKKHIESFLTSKDKKYKYYYKKNIFFKKTKNKYNTNFNKELKNFYCLQSNQSGFLGIQSIKATLKLIKWFLKKFNMQYIKYKINFFPDFALTERGKETRMGKGKGAFKEKVAFVKKNQILIEFAKPVDEFGNASLLKLLKDCKIKLGKKVIIKKNIW